MPNIAHQEERPGLRRIAWIMVITMTVLLVLAFVAVVYGFIRQGRLLVERRQSEIPAAAPAHQARALGALTLAPGVRIVSAQGEGGKLVLHLTGPAGDEVQVIDMASGALVQQVRTQK